MIIYINERHEIKDVDKTTQDNLIALVIPDEDNPFKGWSKSKICCYKVQLDKDGNIGGYYPYIDTRMVEQLDRLSVTDEENEEMINANTDGILEVYESTDELSSKSNDLEDAVLELYEMLGGTE